MHPARLLISGLLIVALGNGVSARADNAPAYRALQHGQVDEASSLLRLQLAQNPSDAGAHQLLCRAAYAEEMADTAVDECQKAVAAAPTSGENQMWLGRALGLKAAHANKLSAFGLARQAHNAFERAVQLSPENARAASDLGEYYIAAPGIVGGGSDKAHRLAQSISSRFPAQSHRLLALLAEKQGDLAGAEREFKAAVAAGESAEAYIDLGFFYQRHQRPDEAATTISKALAADRTRGEVLVDAASILTDANRLPDVAEKALREYLDSGTQTDAAPVFKVHVQLGKLLAARGDRTGAKQQYQAALALAANYGPARKALSSLG
ncbi:tetratricopeptide repeat protein [Granulicella sp. WH15]|uniref:tetratricopeptide repeat protein n=1 Tax=Granulicella sp. WH15 TaxID=2602070 RepID=UPI002103A3FE|nr:tetratricopeptide repeat protein [Granulicella sp. WH15]